MHCRIEVRVIGRCGLYAEFVLNLLKCGLYTGVGYSTENTVLFSEIKVSTCYKNHCNDVNCEHIHFQGIESMSIIILIFSLFNTV